MDYERDPLLGCWISKAAPNSAGYPVVRHRGRVVLHRRVVWERDRGEISAGYDLRSMCEEKRCVNPAHMEAIDGLLRRRQPRRSRRR